MGPLADRRRRNRSPRGDRFRAPGALPAGATPLAAAALALLALAVAAAPARAATLGSYDLGDVQVRYPPGFVDYLIPHVAACSQDALRFHEKLYGYTPSEPVNVLLEDFSDFGHGGANTVPGDFIDLGIAPFNYVYDTIPAVDRMFWMANHEMAHIATMDQAADRDLTFRKVFGGKVDPTAEHPESILYNYLTTPRWNAPRWYHEGIAVFLETWMGGGLGRALGAYDEMVFRTMVLDDVDFFDVVGLESEGTAIDFQVGVNSYLYGTRFMSYLALQYGPEKLIEWTGRRPGSAAYFSTQFRRVYGRSLEEEWQRWIAWEHDFQRQNLEAVRRYPLTAFRPLGPSVGSASRAFLDPRRHVVYLAQRLPGQLPHIVALDLATGRTRRIVAVPGGALFYVTSLAYDRAGDRLFYTADNYNWRDLMVVDLATGKSRRLMRDARVGDLAFDATTSTLWGVRHFNGISTLVTIAPPYTQWHQVRSFPYGQDLYDLDVSPDGALVTGSLAEVDGRQRLVAMKAADLLAGSEAFDTLYDFEVASPANFTFSPDGRYLYGTSYYSGVSNVYRWDVAARDLSVLTNADTGLFRPVPLGDGSLLAFRYTGKGLVPGIVTDQPIEHVGAIRFLGNAIVDRHPIVKEWKVPPPKTDEVTAGAVKGEYASLRHLRFETAYPVVQGYKNTAALGVHATFADPLNLSGLELTLAGSNDDRLQGSENVHARALFHHWNWTAEGTYNRADFYDLFGPTKTSRRGYSLGVGWGRTLRLDEPSKWTLAASVTGWGNLETLPDAQGVPAGTDKLLEADVRLGYESLEKSLGAVQSEERGTRARLELHGRRAGGDSFPRVHLDLDHGWLLPLDHSSLWLRGSVGRGFGPAGQTLSNFYFGGFGNNWVDHQEVARYRLPESFPGVDIDSIGGRDYARLMAEWTLPPLRFRHVGTPGFYLTWARLAFFGAALRTDFDRSELALDHYDLGAQLDFKLVLFSNLSSTLSLGYAVARLPGDRHSDEAMVSLKIL